MPFVYGSDDLFYEFNQFVWVLLCGQSLAEFSPKLHFVVFYWHRVLGKLLVLTSLAELESARLDRQTP